jgi:hypothetical protein
LPFIQAAVKIKLIHTGKLLTEKSKPKMVKNMLIITCSCGAQFLVVPDLKAMDKAVQIHLTQSPKCSEDYLAQQIIKVISQNSV